MADPLTEAFETIRTKILDIEQTILDLEQTISNIEQTQDEIIEKLKEIQRNHNQQIGQIERLFHLYKETQIELDDLKKNTNKNYIDTILNQNNKEKQGEI